MRDLVLRSGDPEALLALALAERLPYDLEVQAAGGGGPTYTSYRSTLLRLSSRCVLR